MQSIDLGESKYNSTNNIIFWGYVVMEFCVGLFLLKGNKPILFKKGEYLK